ncbi:hypothetical protein KFL_000440360 [Klebsormidium nitens]|uniref:AI-2E family transporter n=1 Tax=Klebsormidium nitens TaxID=105231 RepID=A0A1Y1HN17_KLENI|nr:hypothetical protein KFL_000440360 [Klebsormidium nitens]|eukprot:GAQ80035.1 hypothetical protein KFL_000440360 [Klebsormidium nitens]
MAAQTVLGGSQALPFGISNAGGESGRPSTSISANALGRQPFIQDLQASRSFQSFKRARSARIHGLGSSPLRQNKKHKHCTIRAQVTDTNSPASSNPTAVTFQAKLDAPSGTLSNFTSVLQELPVKKIAIWAIVIGASYQMRAFLGVSMGTFILAFIGNALVAEVEKVLPGRRKLVVVIMYAVIVSLLVTIGVFAVPRVMHEAADIINRIQQNENPYNLFSDKVSVIVGEDVVEQVERFLLMVFNPTDAQHKVLDISVAGDRAARSKALERVVKDYSGVLIQSITVALTATSRFVLSCAVSLLFSFMIVWDLPTLQRGAKSLRESRLSAVYEEIAPAVATFGRLFGKALQAQSAIAVVNTLLTGLGCLFLRLPGVLGLSIVVFICSFVPVAGVFLSTIPIGLVALAEYGAFQLLLVIAMVVVTHAIEAYVLNPVIYSAHLKLHPLLVLAVLVFAEHTLGVWGLLIAVPLAVFFIEYVVNRTPMEIEEGESLKAEGMVKANVANRPWPAA